MSSCAFLGAHIYVLNSMDVFYGSIYFVDYSMSQSDSGVGSYGPQKLTGSQNLPSIVWPVTPSY
jgi:hypothetical protein